MTGAVVRCVVCYRRAGVWNGRTLTGTRNRVDGVNTPDGPVLVLRCRCGAQLSTTEQQLAAGVRVLQPLDWLAEVAGRDSTRSADDGSGSLS